MAAALVAACLVAVPGTAFAGNPTYPMQVVSHDAPKSLSPGDTFSVDLVLSRDGASVYTMYAMSSTVRYDTSMLEV